MNERDEPAQIPEGKGTEAVDDLMDSVAALLKSQMRTANRHLRKRAARLLSPPKIRPSGTADSPVGPR